MSLTMQEAMRRCDVRLGRLDSLPEVEELSLPGLEVVSRADLVVCCLGTDVPGRALVQVLAESAEDCCIAVEHMGACDCEGSEPPALTCVSRIPITGGLLRSFWLGYEFGRAER